MQLKKGTYLQGEKYRVISTLGQGGFGITYLAEQVMAKRNVCIKEFFPKEYYNRDSDSMHILLGSEGNDKMMNAYKAKFIKEAQTIANLHHPNIIRIFDVFEENNTAYYAMEYIDGESLNAKVKREGALAEDMAVKYIRDVASALRYIHNRNIMHLDVKPANIMLRKEDDSAVLIDFGLSKQYDNTGKQTSATPVGISHGYAPMEQYQEGGVSTFSPVTDIYSLGATLYYLVIGKVPAEAATIGEDGIGALPMHLSWNVRNAITRSMGYWRKDRPKSIDIFLALLDKTPSNKEVREIRDVRVFNDADDTTKITAATTHVTHIVSPRPTQNPTPNPPRPKNLNNIPNKSKDVDDGKSHISWVLFIVLFIVLTILGAKAIHNNIDEESGLEIHYTTDNNKKTQPRWNEKFNKDIVSNTYKNGKGTIVLPQNATSIDEQAFYLNTDLETISLPDGIKRIGDEAFSHCTDLTSITLPESIEDIGFGVFSYCYKLSEFKGKYAEDNGRILVKDGKLIAFAPAGLTEYTIPNYVTSIGEGAFKHCTFLTSVSIPDSVISIGEGAFYGCKGLTNVTIPDSVTSIGDSAFAWCTCLKDVTIPKNLTSFDESIFYGCDNLMSIAIPNDISTFGEIFRGCGVKELIIPDNITVIDSSAFEKCKNLEYVFIPESVNTINYHAFYDCKKLKTVMCESITPPKLGEEVFYYGVYNQYNYKTTYYRLGCKIYVPKESVKAYKEAEGWSEYAKDIIGYDFKRDPKRLIKR